MSIDGRRVWGIGTAVAWLNEVPAVAHAKVYAMSFLRVSTRDESPHARLVCGLYARCEQKGHWHEPNFLLKRGRLYLYQAGTKAGQWAIGSRRGGSSYRAASCEGTAEATPCGIGALLSGAPQRWRIFTGSEWAAASFEVAEVAEADEAAAEPAAQLVVSSRFDNIAGLYVRRASEAGGPRQCAVGQYYNVEDDKVLWHNASHAGGAWMISDPR